MPLELPRGEAAHVKVELVQAGLGAVPRELDLEFQLVSLDRQSAHGTLRTNARPSPGAVRRTSRELVILNSGACLFAEASLVGHLGLRAHSPFGGAVEWESHARCQEVRRRERLSGTQWKAATSLSPCFGRIAVGRRASDS
jgi:hypothetical protein